MSTNQELRQATVRGATGMAFDYNGDWSALFDLLGSTGDWNSRMLGFINASLGTAYTEINGAMAAFAVSKGVQNWNSLGAFM